MEWRPQPRQEDFLSCPAREILFGGARGGGKSEATFPWLGKPAIHGKHSRYRGLVLRETAESLADWVDRANEIYSKTGAKLIMSPTPRFIWPWGAKIFTGHLKDTRSIQKYIGREFQRILIEELTQLSDENIYHKLLGSLRSTIPGLDSRMAATTNPGGPGHYWVKKRFVDPFAPNTVFREYGTDLTRCFIPSLVTDNPILCENDPEYVKFLDNLPEKLKRAWRYGDWNVLEGAYFTEFARRTHTCPPFEIPSSWAKFMAMDWGYYPDPCVCLWFAVSADKRRKEVLYRERHWTRTIPEDVAKDIKLINRDRCEDIGYAVADPSMWASKSGPSDAERMMGEGLSLIKADNERVSGWTRMHEMLKLREVRSSGGVVQLLPQLKIFNTCTKSIESIELAQHSERNPMDIADNPLDHWIDGIRYYGMSRAGRGKIKDKIPDVFSLKAMRYRKERGYG